MERRVHLNWIGGRWVAAAGGATFEVGDRVGGPECWPRSGAEDARAAVEACAVAAARWGAWRRSARVECLRRLGEAFDAGALVAALAGDLGLEPEELRPRLDEELFRAREAVELVATGSEARGVGFFRAHWSDLVGGLAARVSARLIAGQAVLVLSDPRLPRATEAFALACERAQLPSGLIAALHADTRPACDALLDTPGLAFVRLKDTDERLDTLGQRTRAAAEPAWEAWRVANASRVLRRDADPVRAAEEVVRAALGRSSTLSGQCPGQTARVLCHERLFSRFTEELLARLEGSPDVARPVPPLDADLVTHLSDAWSLGLDEGATPIFGAPPDERDDAPSTTAVGERAIVFTNVDPRSALARLSRPAPVLSLIRVASDGAAEELAAELDGQPRRVLHAAQRSTQP